MFKFLKELFSTRRASDCDQLEKPQEEQSEEEATPTQSVAGPPDSHGQEIKGVRLFFSPPTGLDELNPGAVVLPHDFIGRADAEMELGGELEKYMSNMGDVEAEEAPRMDAGQMRGFFERQAGSPLWKLFHADGASGSRYYLLVDFEDNSATAADTEERRKEIYEEFESALQGAIIEATLNPSVTQGDSVEDYAMKKASSRVMFDRGLEQETMLGIINEGSDKWSQFRGL